jgi:hypothetical protein
MIYSLRHSHLIEQRLLNRTGFRIFGDVPTLPNSVLESFGYFGLYAHYLIVSLNPF